MGRLLIGIGAALALAALCASAWSWATRNPQGLELRALGEAAGQAYVYGYPLVLSDVTRRTMVHAPAPPGRPDFELNTLAHIRALPSPATTNVIRPNVDTLYSIAWLDLAAGPVELDLPAMGERYYLAQLLDAWTNTAAAPGTRLNGGAPGRYLITGPGGAAEAEPGQTLIRSPTSIAWIILRIETAGGDDISRVHVLQDAVRLTGPTAARPASPPGANRPPDQVAAMTPEAFFNALAELMADNPAAPDDTGALADLASLGIEPGTSLDGSRFGPLARTAIARGVETARKRLADAVLNRPAGWTVHTTALGRYGTDYALRAGVARIGLGANWPEDAVYPSASSDASGAGLHGDHAYRIRFAPGGLPPVNAFWSITVYDEAGYLSENTIDRYALGDRDALQFDPDGSLTLYLQSEDPGPGQRANWLPTPVGENYALTARLYWPQDEVLRGDWRMPPIERVER
ncbi:MAG: DUF1254 domain-containing protein [Pseudomonadota bacterium]